MREEGGEMRLNVCVTPLLLLIMFAAPGCGSEAAGEVADDIETGNAITVQNFNMTWNLNNGAVEITMSAPTTGWIAVGFEPSSAMKDANIIIGYIADEEVFISDDWGDGFISHRADTDLGGSSDVSVISGSEADGTTEITFSIPLDSGDSYDKTLEAGESYKVILAFGPDESDDFQGYHVWAETIELEL